MQSPLALSVPSHMLATSHSLAHRGPGATRPRARWQPYTQASTSTPRSSHTPYLHTPASSVTSSPPTIKHPQPARRPEQGRNSPNAPVSLARQASLRDLHKTRYVTALVDQAVKSLSEIWQAQDVPVVFNIPTAREQSTSSVLDMVQPRSCFPSTSSRNIQLPSPVTPSTESTGLPTPATSPADPCSMHGMRYSTTPGASTAAAPSSVPLRGFVQEVLRRSKTSANVLQTALCYIEAIRSKVPDFVQQEKMGFGSKPEPELDQFIAYADVSADPELIEDTAHMDTAATPLTDLNMRDVNVATVRVEDSPDLPPSPASTWLDASSPGGSTSKQPRSPPEPLTPLPALPSPMLCPRRTFLAAVILASKFTQDRCYSNKAWAKLAGLPPREIGRCERALGAALEWRLWVGKLPETTTSAGTGSGSSSGRSIARCRSESDVLGASPVEPPVINVRPTIGGRQRSGLGRSSTLPSTAFAGNDEYSTTSSLKSLGVFPASHPGMVLSSRMLVESPIATPPLSFSPASTASIASMDDPSQTIRMTTWSDADIVSHSPAVMPFVPCTGAHTQAFGGYIDSSFVTPSAEKAANALPPVMLWDMGLTPGNVQSLAVYDHWTE